MTNVWYTRKACEGLEIFVSVHPQWCIIESHVVPVNRHDKWAMQHCSRISYWKWWGAVYNLIWLTVIETKHELLWLHERLWIAVQLDEYNKSIQYDRFFFGFVARFLCLTSNKTKSNKTHLLSSVPQLSFTCYYSITNYVGQFSSIKYS